MLAGALAGSATVLITNPIWVVNTRMTAAQSSSRKPSTLSTLISLIRDEGPTALFAGVLPALVLVINPILQYTIFERLKSAVETHRRGGILLPRDAFVLGAIGKLLATGITYPYITVKSRQHVTKKQDQLSDGIIGSLARIIREEGPGGLYRGIGPKITQSVLTAAFLFAFKDVLYKASIQARRKVPGVGLLKR